MDQQSNQSINQMFTQSIIFPSMELRQFKTDQERFVFWRASTPIQN